MSFDATNTTHTPIHTRTHTLLTFPYQCHVILVAVVAVDGSEMMRAGNGRS